jgi:hypothetical protein
MLFVVLLLMMMMMTTTSMMHELRSATMVGTGQPQFRNYQVSCELKETIPRERMAAHREATNTQLSRPSTHNTKHIKGQAPAPNRTVSIQYTGRPGRHRPNRRSCEHPRLATHHGTAPKVAAHTFQGTAQ